MNRSNLPQILIASELHTMLCEPPRLAHRGFLQDVAARVLDMNYSTKCQQSSDRSADSSYLREKHSRDNISGSRSTAKVLHRLTRDHRLPKKYSKAPHVSWKRFIFFLSAKACKNHVSPRKERTP